jgi:hypothetical protein
MFMIERNAIRFKYFAPYIIGFISFNTNNVL